jgi:DNA-binding NtrC family response regulator
MVRPLGIVPKDRRPLSRPQMMQYRERMARILVVSDEKATVASMQSALETAGHSVLVASSVWSADTCLRGDGIDVLLADLQLRECQDPNVLAYWREEFHGMKILVLSESVTVADFLSLRMKGAADVLQLPLAPDALLQAVHAALHEEA